MSPSRRTKSITLIGFLLLVAVTWAQKASSAARRDGRKLADTLMAKLVAGKAAEVINDEFQGAPENARKPMAAALERQLGRCGRPVNSHIDGAPIEGEDVRNGKTYPVLNYLYLSTTTTHKNVTFYISVEVGDGGQYVVFLSSCFFDPLQGK
jgi:hypothetical protein